MHGSFNRAPMVNGQPFVSAPQHMPGPSYAPIDDQYGPPYDGSSPGTGGSPQSPSQGGYSPGQDSLGGSPNEGDGSGGEEFMDKDYTEYTEQAGKGSPTQKVDPDSGVSVRRPTDLVCVLIFLVYIIGMLLFLAIVKNTSIDGRAYSDVRRLTHGMDYEARLCGVDDGVQAKPYIFWCRDDPAQKDWAVASPLNLHHPVCVEACPQRSAAGSQLGPSQVECMRRPQGQGPPPENAIQPVPNIPGGQFGTVENYFLMFREETVYATTYDSELLAGRYCVPTNETLKADVLAVTGPLGLTHRLKRGIGSFQDCWLVMFFAVLVAVIVSLIYIFVLGSLKDAGVLIVCGCLIAVSILLAVLSVLLFLAVSNGAPFFTKQQYMEVNIFYTRASESQAFAASMISCVILLILSFGSLSFFTNVNGSESKIESLLEAAWSALMHMKSLFFIPALLAVGKYFAMWLICANFMNLCSVGMYDDYRIVVEGELFAGMSKNFYFDPWMWWGILIYVVGGFWLLEIFTSLGQFVISWCAVIYYFTSKDEDNDKVDIRAVAWKGLLIALRYHAGSILFGAFGIWFFRIPRMIAWLWSESLPHEDSNCGLSTLNLCWKPIGRCFDCCAGNKSARKKAAGKWQSGDSLLQQWSKDAYQDVTIRTTHFWQAKEKAQKYINSQKDVRRLTGECRPCTFIGVLAASIAGFLVSYFAISLHGTFNDPSKATFIQDPLMVSFVAFVLCAYISYDFCALLDHMADSLLYSFAYNKKFNKKTIDRFVPEEIQDLIGKEEIEHTKKPPLVATGQAPPNMFLATWTKSMKHTFQGWGQGGDGHH